MLVAFNWTAAPESVQEIGLNDFDRFVALGGHGESEFSGKVGELAVKFRPCGIESGGNSTDWGRRRVSSRVPERMTQKRGFLLVVSRNGEREQTSEGVWKVGSNRLQWNCEEDVLDIEADQRDPALLTFIFS